MSSRYSDDPRGNKDPRDERREGENRRSDRERDGRPDRVDDRKRDERYSDSRDTRRDKDTDRDRYRDEKRDRSRDRDRERERDRDHHRSSHRDRSRSRSRSPERSHSHRHRRRSRSASSSSSSGSEDSYDRERRERRKEKKRSRDKESKEERRERKEQKRLEKKEKKKSKKSSSAALTSQWGTYGIISASDRTSKEAEFNAWLIEERKINPETLQRGKEKKEFLVFVDDYNTATLPHEKYYDMVKYEVKMKMLREGMVSDMADTGYDPAKDLASHSSNLRRKPAETESYLSKQQLEELRSVQRERSEIAQRKLLGMDISKKLGVRSEVADKMFR